MLEMRSQQEIMCGWSCPSETKVSICCITYNHERFIAQTIDGFLMQDTAYPFEVLIHDDASTDRTAEIIRNYEVEYPDIIKPIYQTENQYSKGVDVFFLNSKRALGKYIAVCEGDDYWTNPLKLQMQVDFMENHEGYSMCCTAFTQSFEVKESFKSEILLDIDEIKIDDILLGLWIGTLTVVFRKEMILDYIPPFNDLPFGDLPLWCHLAMKGEIKYFKFISANYRSLSESACHFKDLIKQAMFILSAMRVIEYYAQKSNRINKVKSRLAKMSHCCFEECYNNQWFDFPMDILWRFVEKYGNPTGYDWLRKWGLESRFKYKLSKLLIAFLKRI